MGAGLVIDIVKKGGPYLAIAVLVGLLYMDHLKLVACQSQNDALTMSNRLYKGLTEKQNKDIARSRADEADVRKKMADLSSRFTRQDTHVRIRIQRILKTAPDTTCEKAVQWAVKQSRSL